MIYTLICNNNQHKQRYIHDTHTHTLHTHCITSPLRHLRQGSQSPSQSAHGQTLPGAVTAVWGSTARALGPWQFALIGLRDSG